MGNRGAEFSDLEPRGFAANGGNANGIVSADFTQNMLSFAVGSPGNLQHGLVQPFTPNNAFRPGQQIIFWIGIYNPVFDGAQGDVWATSLRLKPWWARPNMEYRQAYGGNGSYGAPFAASSIDQQVFLSTNQLNKYVWVPSPKRLDVTEYITPPPPAAVPRTSDSLMLDDVWKWDLEDATAAAYIADFPAPQVPSRWSVFLYPAMGYALGFTWEATFSGDITDSIPLVGVNLMWSVGTLGGTNYQESVG